jgi:hypothetical protein
MTREVQAVAGIVGRIVDGCGTGETHYIEDGKSERDGGRGVP